MQPGNALGWHEDLRGGAALLAAALAADTGAALWKRAAKHRLQEEVPSAGDWGGVSRESGPGLGQQGPNSSQTA